MAIRFKSLGYIYDKNMPYAHVALDDINLEIKQGIITAIIGETGSGKSTLVEHLNGLLQPTSGSLEILEHELKPNEKDRFLKLLRKDVGLVFQFSEYQLFEETILKDVMFGPKNFGYSLQECQTRAMNALSLVGIGPEYYEVSPLEISGGQKRRIAIAGILAIDPEVIVLDEPTAGLDPMGAKEIINLFVNLNKKLHKTIIIVSHDNEMVYNYCDETVVLNHGKVGYAGLTLDLFDDVQLMKKFNLLQPQIVAFKNMLKEKGFKISKQARTIESIGKEVLEQIR